jgi:hypothetical protein
LPRPHATTPPAKRPTTPPPTSGRTPSTPPPLLPSIGRTDTEAELSLRRQLARLMHQLAEAQRDLATKDEELAGAVEKRIESQAAYDVLLDQQREAQELATEAAAYRARTAGIEQRLQEATAAADELRHQLERERSERAAVMVQFDEANAAFERARNQWRDESATIDQQHAAQLAQLDQQRRAALDAAEAAKNAALERQREAHDAELDALRTAHERSLAALTGELEPKVVEVRKLAAEIERVTSEAEAQRSEHTNLMTERIELHKWELAQLAEAHEADMAAQARAHAGEITRLKEEVVAANQAGELIDRNASLREQLWEQTVGSLRDSQKKLQHELGEAKEKAAQGDANKWSVEQRLVSSLQSVEKLEEENRSLRVQLEAAEQGARRNATDRERFAAYLEQGLAMLGAVPPRSEPEHVEPEPEPEPATISPHDRETRQYQAIVDPPDIELEIDAEAPPLPEPTRP